MDEDELDEINRATSTTSFLEKRWFRITAIVVSALILLSFALPVILPLFEGNSDPETDGQAMPNFTLGAAGGGEITLSNSAAGHSFVVLVFHRGSACQSCRNQLLEYQESYTSLQAEDTEVLAITMDTQASAEAMTGQLGIRFPMLYDGSATAADYGFRGFLQSEYMTVTLIVDDEMQPVTDPVGTLNGEVLPASALLNAIRQAKNAAATEG